MILKILKGEYEKLDYTYSKELLSLLNELLNINSEMRPDVKHILEKPLMLKYIKLNLIRQLSNVKSSLYIPNNLFQEQNFVLENLKINEENSELNLNYISALSPSQISVDSNKVSFIASDELNVYKIASDSTSKNSSGGLSSNKKTISNEISNEPKNSVFNKIEKLKKFLEKFLGLETFLEIYFKINVFNYNLGILP